MKKVLVLLAVVMATSVNAQSDKKSRFQAHRDSVKKLEIAYATPTKDTLYILAEMFPIMDTIWNHPMNINERPILIPVKSIIALKTSLLAKEEE